METRSKKKESQTTTTTTKNETDREAFAIMDITKDPLAATLYIYIKDLKRKKKNLVLFGGKIWVAIKTEELAKGVSKLHFMLKGTSVFQVERSMKKLVNLNFMEKTIKKYHGYDWAPVCHYNALPIPEGEVESAS